jgi:predicted RNA-binding Zn ribbon-like protein
MLLICRPGEGVEPSTSDRQVFELLRLAHDACAVPLADAVLVDGRRWCSMAGR